MNADRFKYKEITDIILRSQKIPFSVIPAKAGHVVEHQRYPVLSSPPMHSGGQTIWTPACLPQARFSSE
ncbi:MAG: hypothetical protein ACNYWU_07300 [Desulfobacterales bacterium]